MRVHKKYTCGTGTQLPASQKQWTHGLATSVGSVFGKPGPHTHLASFPASPPHARALKWEERKGGRVWNILSRGWRKVERQYNYAWVISTATRITPTTILCLSIVASTRLWIRPLFTSLVIELLLGNSVVGTVLYHRYYTCKRWVYYKPRVQRRCARRIDRRYTPGLHRATVQATVRNGNGFAAR